MDDVPSTAACPAASGFTAAADATSFGIRIVLPHLGHVPSLPAMAAVTVSVAPHLHLRLIAISIALAGVGRGILLAPPHLVKPEDFVRTPEGGNDLT